MAGDRPEAALRRVRVRLWRTATPHPRHAWPPATVGLQVRADDGHETYLAVRIEGSVPPNLTTLILRHVPG